MQFTQQKKKKGKTKPFLIWLLIFTNLKRTVAHRHVCTCMLNGTLVGCQRFEMCVRSLQVCEIAWGVVCVKRSTKQPGGGVSPDDEYLLDPDIIPSKHIRQALKSTRFSRLLYEFVYLFICWQDTRGGCQSGVAWKHPLHLPVLSLPTSHIAAAQITDQWQGSVESWQSTSLSLGLH